MKTFAVAAAALAAGAAATPSKRASITPITINGNGASCEQTGQETHADFHSLLPRQHPFLHSRCRLPARYVQHRYPRMQTRLTCSGGSSAQADPIADTAGCQRDIAKFKDLGLNTIRVYTVDNTANHDTCMNALADAGIYLALDVNSPNYSINRANPARSYNKAYLQSVFATIDAFQKYPNTLLFFSGNEVINDDATTAAAPFIKAVDRDMRSYINARGYRKIPVGYSAADVASNRMEMAQYMNCGPDGARSDFFSFNDYSWCDPNTFSGSDWGQKVKNFTDYSIPIL